MRLFSIPNGRRCGGLVVPIVIAAFIVAVPLTPLLLGSSPLLRNLAALLAIELRQLTIALGRLLVEIPTALSLVELLVAVGALLPLLLPVVTGSAFTGVEVAVIATRPTARTRSIILSLLLWPQ